MGPFRMGDLAGNDIGWAIRKRRAVEKPDMTYSKTADLLCELGRYGQKTGSGWYDYKAGDRTAYPSQQVDAMVVKHSKDIGVTRRISDEGNRRATGLCAGQRRRAHPRRRHRRQSLDIDIVYLAGYGFPIWRGGPMFYADSVGLYNVLGHALRERLSGRRVETCTSAS
jgi:3-hydroxyacyl-CoA dehydrogenase